jgi:hypothetical protein
MKRKVHSALGKLEEGGYVLPSARRLLLRERDVLNLPIVISGVEDVVGSCYVLQAATGVVDAGVATRSRPR